METMEQSEPKIGWVRIAAALLLSFLFLIILIPHTGRIHMDSSTTPPTFRVVDRPQEIAKLVAMLIVPLAWIYFGARRSGLMEFAGWFLLIAFFALATSR